MKSIACNHLWPPQENETLAACLVSLVSKDQEREKSREPRPTDGKYWVAGSLLKMLGLGSRGQTGSESPGNSGKECDNFYSLVGWLILRIFQQPDRSPQSPAKKNKQPAEAQKLEQKVAVRAHRVHRE